MINMQKLTTIILSICISGCQTVRESSVVAPESAEYMRRYMSAPGYKAMAGTEHQGGHVYHWAVGKASLQAAIDESLKKCNEGRILHQQYVPCRLYMLNQTAVRGVGDEELQKIKDREAASPPPKRSDFPHLEDALKQYHPLSPVKALAGAVSANGAYAYSWKSGATTIDLARRSALEKCNLQKRKWDIQEDCEILFEGDRDVRNLNSGSRTRTASTVTCGMKDGSDEALAREACLEKGGIPLALPTSDHQTRPPAETDRPREYGGKVVPDHQRNVMLYLPAIGKTTGRIAVRNGLGVFMTKGDKGRCEGLVIYAESTHGTWNAKCGSKAMAGQFRDLPSGHSGMGSATSSDHSVASIEFGPREITGEDEAQTSVTQSQKPNGAEKGLAVGTWGGRSVSGFVTSTNKSRNEGRITRELGTVKCEGLWTVNPGASAGLVAAGCGGDLSITGDYKPEGDNTYSFMGTDSQGERVVLRAKF